MKQTIGIKLSQSDYNLCILFDFLMQLYENVAFHSVLSAANNPYLDDTQKRPN